jgi:hypothetical protein
LARPVYSGRIEERSDYDVSVKASSKNMKLDYHAIGDTITDDLIDDILRLLSV